MKVIEDSSQAHGTIYYGTKTGNLGDAFGFSFYLGKNMGEFGDARSRATNYPKLANILRHIQTHGYNRKYFYI